MLPRDSAIQWRTWLRLLMAVTFLVCGLVLSRHLRHCVPGAPDRELRRTMVRLGWLVNANSAGQVAAVELGYYRQEGLDVQLLPGGLNSPSVKTVAAGADLFGFANSPDLVLRACASGAPLIIVATIQQEGYHAFLVREDSDIHCPSDWAGRRVGVKLASPTYLLYQVLLRTAHVDRAAIREIPIEYGIEAFLAGDIDVYPGARTNEALALAARGVRVRAIRPSDYGVETCGNVLFVTRQTLDREPNTVRGFVRATLRGWDWCLVPENHRMAVEFLLRHNDQLHIQCELEALRMNGFLVDPSGNRSGIGLVNADKLGSIARYMQDTGLLTNPVSVSQLYTNQFVSRYLQTK